MPGPPPRPPRHFLYEQATRLESLERAWLRVLRNGGAAGGDGLTVADFARSAAVRLISLQRSLRDGSYRPGPLRRVAIPKPTGGERILLIPAVTDRIVQTAVTEALVPVLEPEFEDVSFAYRPGRSVAQAVERVRSLRADGYLWVIDGDIERYFDRVPHDPLLGLLEKYLDDPALLDLIAQWLEQVCSETGGSFGLPQGSPLSPLLSNLYLDQLDDAAQDAALGAGVRLVRYADDFVVLCRSEKAARSALGKLADMLARLGLGLHADKTRVVSFDQGFRFLGHLFVRSLVVASPEPAAASPDGLLQALALRDDRQSDQDRAAEQDRAAGLSAVTRVLYVMEKGRSLALRNHSLTVCEGDQELLAFGPGRVDRIEIGPVASFDPEALRASILDGIPLHLVDGHGQAVGVCAPALANHAGLHLAQAQVTLDADLRLAAARAVVVGRVHNQRAVLRRLNRSRKDSRIARAATDLGVSLRKIPHLQDIAALMGTEGHAAALYWPALGLCLRSPWTFELRERRPPPDPVNLVLGWLSALLTREAEALVLRHGLHPGFGSLHGTRDDHQGCVYDLIEPFRAPLVEALTITLFNQRHLMPDDFDTSDPAHCRILPDGRRTVIRQWEAWLDKPVRSPRSGERRRWRGILEDDILAFARHVRAPESTPWQPFALDY